MRATIGSFLVVFLAFGLRADGNGSPQPGSPGSQPSAEPTKLDVIQKQLKDITVAIEALQAGVKLGETNNRLKVVENEILNLKDSLARLESSINSIKTEDRRSYYSAPPISPVPNTDTPKTQIAAKPISDNLILGGTVGTLKLVNSSVYNASVILNGVTYRVEAGQTITVPGMPTGEFNYEVAIDSMGIIQPKVARKLAAAETFTLYIYPR